MSAAFVPLDHTVREIGVAVALIIGFSLIWPLNKAMTKQSQRDTAIIGTVIGGALIAALNMLSGGVAERPYLLTLAFGFGLLGCASLVLSVVRFVRRDNVTAMQFLMGCPAFLALSSALVAAYAGNSTIGNRFGFTFLSLAWVAFFISCWFLMDASWVQRTALAVTSVPSRVHVRRPKVDRPAGSSSSRKPVKKGNRHNRSKGKRK